MERRAQQSGCGGRPEPHAAAVLRSTLDARTGSLRERLAVVGKPFEVKGDRGAQLALHVGRLLPVYGPNEGRNGSLASLRDRWCETRLRVVGGGGAAAGERGDEGGLAW